jgi:type IV pilus biogenesis protein CpaD/CtpE
MNNLKKFLYWLSLCVVLLAILILSSCEPSKGPKLTSECNYSTTISINVIEYDNEATMKSYYEKLKPEMKKQKYALKGFATKNTRTEVHTLHILAIRGQNDSDRIETLGHELMHSFCGEWHPANIVG